MRAIKGAEHPREPAQLISIGSLVSAQHNWIPLLECDGTHMKNRHYNGICVLIVGKDGNWTNIPAAIAFIHKETAENFEWFFANCVAAGIKLHGRAVFSDRGKQRDAQVRLSKRNIQVNLKFCALHIFFNVCGHIRAVDPNIDNINGLLFRLQATTTLVEYETTLEVIQKQFPAVRTRTRNGRQQSQSVAAYLRTIHPTSWTKVGNCPLTPEEQSEINAEWATVEAFGHPCPLFSGRTTSAVEGQNNALLWGGVRDCQVLGGLVKFCNMAIKTVCDKKKQSDKWLDEDNTVTPRAKAMFKAQVWGATACTVRRSTRSIFFVDDLITSLEELDTEQVSSSTPVVIERKEPQQRTFTVDLEGGTCTRCVDRQLLQLPCRHIIASVYDQSGCHTSTAGAFKFYHRAYTVPAYAQTYQDVSVSMPFIPALLLDHSILPPPLYNQAGGSTRRAPRDVIS